MHEPSHIVIRDRRKVRQWSTDNLIQDHWRPIIGARGFDLYSFYLKLSNKADERAFPGYELISNHLGYSSATISKYNLLLEWCDLIHIESGNQFTSNDYYILDVPECTPERRARIRERVLAWNNGNKDNQQFTDALVGRLDAWQPLQHWFKRIARHKPVLIHRMDLHPTNQLTLQAASDSNQSDTSEVEQGSSCADSPLYAPTLVTKDDDFSSESTALQLLKTTTLVTKDDDFSSESRTIRNVQSELKQSEMNNQQQQQTRAPSQNLSAAAAENMDEQKKHVERVLKRAGMRYPAPQTLAQLGVELGTALEWAYWVDSTESDVFERPQGYAIARLKQNPHAEPDGMRNVYDSIRRDPDRFRCMGKCEFCADDGEFARALDELLELEEVAHIPRPATQRRNGAQFTRRK